MAERKNVAVVGLGFVGLPLALSFAMKGANVIGVDVNSKLVSDLKNKVTHHIEGYRGKPIQDILREQTDAGNFNVTTNIAEALEVCDSVVVTVGYEHDYLKNAVKEITKGLKKDMLVLIRSTVVPGTVRGMVKPLLEESGMKCGEDFYLGYASERIAEGKAFDEFENMPTLVSGINEKSIAKIKELLKIITVAELVEASQIEAVETSKVMENLQRDINLAMIQEFSRFTKALGVNIFEVVKLANTHKRVSLLTPGPGVGGYCIPNAYHYLNPKAEELGVDLKISKLCREFNSEIPQYIVSLVLKNLTVAPKDAKIAVLGIAMKDYSSDDRISPARDCVEILLKAGIKVAAYDPAVPTAYDYKVATLEEALDGADGVLLLAKQDNTDYNNLDLFKSKLKKEAFIVDTRNVYTKEEVEAKSLRLETL